MGLLEGLATTRAIRRYRPEPIPKSVLSDILWAATRAPSGSNRQPFRFLVLTNGPNAIASKLLIQQSAQALWKTKRSTDGYDLGSGTVESSPKTRMATTMQEYVDHFDRVPVVILACLVRYRDADPSEGGSIFPACQNLLLAARALGYGGVLTGFHGAVEKPLRALLRIPDNVSVAATITLGKPVGNHGPVRRRPMKELIFEESWNQPASWACDPIGTQFTSAGPPMAQSTDA